MLRILRSLGLSVAIAASIFYLPPASGATANPGCCFEVQLYMGETLSYPCVWLCTVGGGQEYIPNAGICIYPDVVRLEGCADDEAFLPCGEPSSPIFYVVHQTCETLVAIQLNPLCREQAPTHHPWSNVPLTDCTIVEGDCNQLPPLTFYPVCEEESDCCGNAEV